MKIKGRCFTREIQREFFYKIKHKGIFFTKENRKGNLVQREIQMKNFYKGNTKGDFCRKENTKKNFSTFAKWAARNLYKTKVSER